jgi:hypothetical protein
MFPYRRSLKRVSTWGGAGISPTLLTQLELPAASGAVKWLHQLGGPASGVREAAEAGTAVLCLIAWLETPDEKGPGCR